VQTANLRSRKMIQAAIDIGASYPFSASFLQVRVVCGKLDVVAVRESLQQCSGFGLLSQVVKQMRSLVA
jgi:hypothetical protein